MKQYIVVSFEAPAEQREIIAALLLDLGFAGTVEQGEKITGSVAEENFDHTAVEEIFNRFDVSFFTELVEEQNWNATWEKSFEPVAVENFAIIRAGFHAPVAGFEHEIIITPKMSFGTGHHATTFLMIQQMRSIDFKDKHVIDFGTGTAVLAILAEKLGASRILATDNDEWSINNSIENIQTNYCTKIETLLEQGFPAGEKADIILANINLNVILENLQQIEHSLNKGGKVLFSGLLTSDEDQVRAALQTHGFHINQVAEKNGWICLLTSY